MSQRTHKKPRLGVSSIEFALVAPVFFLFVFGIIELGRMVMFQQALTNAAREGSRMAVMATTINSSDVEAAMRNYLQSVTLKASDPAKVRTTVPTGLNNCPSGTELTVAVEVDYRDVSWVPIDFFGLNPRIRAQQTGWRE